MGSLHTNLGCGHVGASSSVSIKQEKLDDKEIMEKKKKTISLRMSSRTSTPLYLSGKTVRWSCEK